MVGRVQHIKINCSTRRVIHIGRHRSGFSRRAYRARHKTGFVGCQGRHPLRLGTCQGCGCKIYAMHLALHTILGLRDSLRIECTGLDYICSRLQILTVDNRNHVGARKCQHIVIARQFYRVRNELSATKILLQQAIALNHSAHSTIKHHYAVL